MRRIAPRISALALLLTGCVTLEQMAASYSNPRLCYEASAAGPGAAAAATAELSARKYVCRPGDARRGQIEARREVAEDLGSIAEGLDNAGKSIRPAPSTNCTSVVRGTVIDTVCR